MKSKNKKNRKQRRARRKFTPEFKADVVRLCQSGGESTAEVSERLDLTLSSVRQWVAKAEDSAGPAGSSLTTNEQEELQRLRRENKRLRIEREILKKAATFFAKENS
jgi:transposase